MTANGALAGSQRRRSQAGRLANRRANHYGCLAPTRMVGVFFVLACRQCLSICSSEEGVPQVMGNPSARRPRGSSCAGGGALPTLLQHPTAGSCPEWVIPRCRESDTRPEHGNSGLAPRCTSTRGRGWGVGRAPGKRIIPARPEHVTTSDNGTSAGTPPLPAGRQGEGSLPRPVGAAAGEQDKTHISARIGFSRDPPSACLANRLGLPLACCRRC
jgi:hypothetical protein